MVLYDCTPAAGTVPNLKLTDLMLQVNEPIQLKNAPDDPDRLYIAQKSGQVVIVENGALLATPFLDISSKVIDSSEEGLLGLAFDPGYATNGRFFVHYSKAGSGDNVVEEYHRSAADIHKADPNPVQLVLEHPTAEPNHNGGAVEFGPDGFLYISMGDGGNQGDPECDAQLLMGGEAPAGIQNLFGKITRLDVNGTPDADGYPAAAGNPNGQKHYHVGFRNPWRISFDVCTGDLYIGDVGQNSYEEVDRITQADGPVNCGWPYFEGTHTYPYNMTTCPAMPANLHTPILDYDHSGGRCAVSGGYVYRSMAIPALRGAYFYGDYCSGNIYYKLGAAAAVPTPLSGGNISAFGQDGRGNVYVLSLGGTVSRIDPM
jgi:glucose/arabinose dehydrogenase